MQVAVLVPRRADGGQRDRVWEFVLARWDEEHPDWWIIEGHDDDDGPFNRSKALNRAAADAESFDVAVIADADSIVDPAQIVAAVELAADSDQMVIAYETFAALDEQTTEAILRGEAVNWDLGVSWRLTGTCSSMLAVSRKLWDTIGGFDQRFIGWGMEDVAFMLAARAIGGGLERVPGTCWHLWHEPQERTSVSVEANAALLHQYDKASVSEAAMLLICADAVEARS